MRKQLLASAGLTLGITLSASAAIRYVDDSAPGGNGTTWALISRDSHYFHPEPCGNGTVDILDCWP